MKRPTIDFSKLSPKHQAMVRRLAKKLGLTVEEVLAQFVADTWDGWLASKFPPNGAGSKKR